MLTWDHHIIRVIGRKLERSMVLRKYGVKKSRTARALGVI